MTANFSLERKKTALLIIDVQDKLFSQVERSCEVMLTIQKVIKGFQILNLPIFVSEQYPKGLGSTIATLKAALHEDQEFLPKTTFSCLKDPAIEEKIRKLKADQWVLVGIEAHVCVLQTAKDLLKKGHEVVVLNDAITSRSLYDFSTAIAEMRDCGARISSAETILFELLGDSQADEFKEMSQLVKDKG
jgi:nicotinamidase-related amidase